MEFILKLYSNQFSTTPYTQVSEILSAKIDENIVQISTATIVIPGNVQGIKKYQFVELCSIESDTDVILFRGFIQDFTPNRVQITLACKNEKAIMSYKKALSTESYTAQTITQILEDILGTWNTAYGDTYTVNTSSTYTPPKKDIKYGDTIFDIIDELATSAECVWDCQDGVIRIEPLLGNDYTVVGNTKEIIYNEDDPQMSNVSEFTPTSGVLASIVLGVDGSNTATKSDSTAIADFGAIAITQQFRKSDSATINTETQKYLDSKKNSNFAYDLLIDQNRIEMDIGDKVLLTIENTGTYTDFSGTALVNEKHSVLVNGSFEIRYTLADQYFVRDDFYNRIQKIQTNLGLNTVK